MGEFADSIRKQAAETLRFLARQECPLGSDPLVELIAHLVDVETATSSETPTEFASTEDWISWNRLVAVRPRVIRAALTATLEWEKPVLPRGEAMMRVWAARLVLRTLDRLAKV